MRHHHHYHHRQRFSVPLGWGRKVYTGYGFAGFIGWLIVAEFALLWFVLVAYYFILRYIFWEPGRALYRRFQRTRAS